jgi:hypothetical protein
MLSETMAAGSVIQLMLALLLSLSGYAGGDNAHKTRPGPKAGDKNFMSFCVVTLVFHVSALVLISFFLRQHQMTWSEAFGFWRGDRLRAVALAVFLTASSCRSPGYWGAVTGSDRVKY